MNRRPLLSFVLNPLKRARSIRRKRSYPLAVEWLETRTVLSADPLSDLYAGLLQDPHDDPCHAAEIDQAGHEYHVLSSLPITTLETDAVAGESANAEATPAALSQTFQLHSNPGAAHTIYLDFDGHTTSGTSWNSSFNAGADIVTPAYDFDGSASVFSDAELTRIQAIWQRVAEDYAPFDVNITTEDPGAGALTKSGSGDSQWGVRVVIGGSSTDWFGASAGGVAYVGSFNWSSDAPTFVFENQLGNGHEKYTTEAISHEVGHTLGLSHDGGSGTSYYSGHGGGATGWAPIMGVGYYQEVSQWSQGEYSGATNMQDDLAIITTNNGFGYRADDHGDTDAAASGLTVVDTTMDGAGIIETSSDVDVFTFTAGAGQLDLTVDPAERGANLDILSELYDWTHTLVAMANPTNMLNASLSVMLTAGQYYLHVSGVGQGDPLTTGYTDYGSLGQYSVSGTLSAPQGDSVSIQANSPSAWEGDVGTTPVTFTVTRTGNTSQATTIEYAVAGSGASQANALDFAGGTRPTGLVTFAAGETSKTIDILVLGDTAIENDESFTVTLANPPSGTQIANASANATIRNDDSPTLLNIAANDSAKLEGNTGSTEFSFTLSRSGDTTGETTVTYAVQGNGQSPADADDFTNDLAASADVTFAAGETSKTITVLVRGDMIVEQDEGFEVSIVSATGNAQILTANAGATILTDDNPGISVTPTSGLTTKETGTTATFDVTLNSRPSPSTSVTIHVRSLDTTEGSVDKAMLTFTADNWDTAQTVTVTGLDDSVRDGSVTYDIELTVDKNSDENYVNLDPDDVQVTNQDNDKGKGGKGRGKGGRTKKSRSSAQMAAALAQSPILLETVADRVALDVGTANANPFPTRAVASDAHRGSQNDATAPQHAMKRAQKRLAKWDGSISGTTDEGTQPHVESTGTSVDTSLNRVTDGLPTLQPGPQIGSMISSSLVRCWKADRWPGL